MCWFMIVILYKTFSIRSLSNSYPRSPFLFSLPFSLLPMGTARFLETHIWTQDRLGEILYARIVVTRYSRFRKVLAHHNLHVIV